MKSPSLLGFPSRLRGTYLLPALVALLFACTYDPDDRCGPHQVLSSDPLRCQCEEGFALTASGCVACGVHEVPGEGGCVCESGYERAADATTCEPLPMSLGRDCDEKAPCRDEPYDFCDVGDSGQGYCTSRGCATSSDCSGGYGCDTSVTPSICRRPPLGLGKSCSSAADCADGEATFCDTFESHQCLVQDCTLAPDSCFVGWECKDLTSLGLAITLCVPEGSL
jgi:hypothetical protein